MATWYSGISKQLRTIRKNIFFWCLLFLLAFGGLILRLTWLQTVAHRHYNDLGERYRHRDVVIPAERGRLLDRNLVPLALDDQRGSLYIDPTLCTYPGEAKDTHRCEQFVADLLAPVIAQPAADILAAMQRQVSFVWVKRDLTPEQIDKLKLVNLPGLQVAPDGQRYRVGVDLAQSPPPSTLAQPLATILGLTVDEVKAQLGVKTTEREIDTPAPAGQRWVGGVYGAGVKTAIEALHFPGLTTTAMGPNVSLGVDPHVYTADVPQVPANRAAVVLAPILGLKADLIERRLQFRPRFAWLKRDITLEMQRQIAQMAGTMYVVEPGKVFDAEEPGADPEKQVKEAVDRLYGMLNDKHAPETISRDEIRRHLQPGSPPGALSVRLINGNPSKGILDRLFNKPIPGVVYGLPGVSIQTERRRRYPFNNMAAPTLGFVGTGHDAGVEGEFGLEQSQEASVHGIDGREDKEVDGRAITIPDLSQRTEPTNGRDVQLTLDRDIQLVADTELAKAVEKSHALGGQCLVMDPATGEILALATAPTWDANTPGKSTVPLVNPTVSNYYEPGSTFKIVAVMAALEEGVVRDGQIITNCTGAFPVGNHVIHEAHHAHGPVDCGRLLEQSCNIGAATLALKLGPQRFLKWCDKLGFGAKTGIEVGNETSGSLNRAHADVRITLANMGFGQSLAVTPLQMAGAYAAVANGGFWVQPHLVRARQRADGGWDTPPLQRRHVCSDKTAALMRGYLERVVTKGTGDVAAIPGYLVGGKTGTAQKPGAHGYGGGKAIGSFIGLLPADKPRLLIIAIIDEPQGSHYGGVVAAPVVREVGLQALRHLNVPPNPAMHGKDQRHQGPNGSKTP